MLPRVTILPEKRGKFKIKETPSIPGKGDTHTILDVLEEEGRGSQVVDGAVEESEALLRV